MDTKELRKKIQDIEVNMQKLEGRGKIKQAHNMIKLYNSLLLLDNNKCSDFLGKARVYAYIIKDYELTLRTVLDAIALFSYDRPLYLLATDTYCKLNKFDKALHYLDIVLLNESSMGFLYKQRAEINRKLGNFEEAKKDQEKYEEYQGTEEAKWDNPNHYYQYK